MRFFARVIAFPAVIVVVLITFGQQFSMAQTSGQADGQVELDSSSSNTEGSLEGDDLEQLEDRAAESLDSLFADLKKQTNEKRAKRITRRIWSEWTRSGSASIDLLMNRAGEAMKRNRNGVALDLLDQVVTLAPDYAEGWNRRATVYYTMKKFADSISDIEQVLRLEPRHFGALSGLAVMLQGLGREKKALETWHRVLEIYPANSQAQESVIKLEDKLSGRAT